MLPPSLLRSANSSTNFVTARIRPVSRATGRCCFKGTSAGQFYYPCAPVPSRLPHVTPETGDFARGIRAIPKFGENSSNLREIVLFHEQQEEDEPDKFSVVAFGVTTDTCTDKKKILSLFSFWRSIWRYLQDKQGGKMFAFLHYLK